MTATDAIWTQGGSFTAAEDRSLISALTGARHFTDLAPGISKVDAGGGHGVVGAADLAVTPGSGHSVDVAAGQAFVRGTQSAGQGTYLVGNDATVNLAVSTPDATNDRIDLVQIRVSDDSAGAGVTTIDVKAGTPAGSPSAPTPDENALVLAEVLVPASAASSANYTITDRRTRAAGLGGTLVCASSATYPNPAVEGMRVYDQALDSELVYTGTKWVAAAALVASELVTITPAANRDVTSGTISNWTTETASVTVPAWATKALVTTAIVGFYDQTPSASDGFGIATSFGGVDGTTRSVSLNSSYPGRTSATFVDEFTGLTAGSKTIRPRARRSSGTGTLRADTPTIFDYRVEFKP